MLQAEKQVRFMDLARAFRLIAMHPDKALNLALEIDDDVINVLESNVHQIAKRLNGDPLAMEIETLLNLDALPAMSSSINVPLTTGDAAKPVWIKFGKRGAPPNEVKYEAQWGGVKLSIQKKGPANYEGFVNNIPFCSGKFKSNVRERLEKEAAKRVA